MVTRRIKPVYFEMLKKDLIKNAKYNPYEQYYDLTMRINKTDYILKIQLTDINRIMLWSVLELNSNDGERINYRMIKNDKILMVMLDIMLWQKTEMFIK